MKTTFKNVLVLSFGVVQRDVQIQSHIHCTAKSLEYDKGDSKVRVFGQGGCCKSSPQFWMWGTFGHMPIQRPNLFWPPNLIGLYGGHVTLAWLKIKCISQKILTCKISGHLVHWGLSYSYTPLPKNPDFAVPL